MCGFHVEEDALRIPSTKRVRIFGVYDGFYLMGVMMERKKKVRRALYTAFIIIMTMIRLEYIRQDAYVLISALVHYVLCN